MRLRIGAVYHIQEFLQVIRSGHWSPESRDV